MKSQTQSDPAIHNEVSKIIKGFAMDATARARSGHPGAPMGTGTIASVLWADFLNYNPDVPDWKNRDRFILSCGHASMLLYSMLYLSGYNLTLEDIKNFRQVGSITPGHPEVGVTPGVEATTGPLGTGFATGVGMAIAERFLADRYNTDEFSVVDYTIYILASDGDIMEGICNEAASIAGHLGLSNIVCLYDSNRITIDGSTDLSFSENVRARFQSMDWATDEADGQDPVTISAALQRARLEKEKPSLIICNTHIGEGSPNTQDTPVCHGSPLDPDEIALTKKNIGLPDEEFFVDPSVTSFFNQLKEHKIATYDRWLEVYKKWEKRYPERAAEWNGETSPDDLFTSLDSLELPAKKEVATRVIVNDVLRASFDHFGPLMGGSADLGCSVKTTVSEISAYSKSNPSGRQIHFGIRENAMGALLNGLTLTRPMRAFAGTFLVFSDFMKPTIRLAALMDLPVMYLFSHDSFAVGEDGPTHQPIEHVMSLRSIPNLFVIRPADLNETIGAWKIAWARKNGPTAIITSRQGIPLLEQSRRDVSRGGYIIFQTLPEQDPDLVLVATGSEVSLALQVARNLADEKLNVRVVSLPCWKLFEAQDEKYRTSILPGNGVKTVSLEAGITQGWSKYAEKTIGIDHFGMSGPFKELRKKFGFTSEAITSQVREYLLE